MWLLPRIRGKSHMMNNLIRTSLFRSPSNILLFSQGCNIPLVVGIKEEYDLSSAEHISSCNEGGLLWR
jgi:hypothetical protein